MSDPDPTSLQWRPLPPISTLAVKPFQRPAASASPAGTSLIGQSALLPPKSAQNRSLEEREAAERIKWLRQGADDLPGALEACLDAVRNYPQNSFFAILAVDLFLALKKPSEATQWLIEALRRWDANNPHFSKLARNLHRLELQLSSNEAMQLRVDLVRTAQLRPVGDVIRRETERLLGVSEETVQLRWSETAILRRPPRRAM